MTEDASLAMHPYLPSALLFHLHRFAAVQHAEVVSLCVGEPFGTLSGQAPVIRVR